MLVRIIAQMRDQRLWSSSYTKLGNGILDSQRNPSNPLRSPDATFSEVGRPGLRAPRGDARVFS